MTCWGDIRIKITRKHKNTALCTAGELGIVRRLSANLSENLYVRKRLRLSSKASSLNKYHFAIRSQLNIYIKVPWMSGTCFWYWSSLEQYITKANLLSNNARCSSSTSLLENRLREPDWFIDASLAKILIEYQYVYSYLTMGSGLFPSDPTYFFFNFTCSYP